MPFTVVSSMATRHSLAQLCAEAQADFPDGVDLQVMGGVPAAAAVRDGRPADVVVLADNVMGALDAEGHIRPGSLRVFARSAMALAIRADAPIPSIRNGNALRDFFASIPAVGYSTGPSGAHLQKLWQTWGLETGATRLVQAPPGVPVAQLIAEGQAQAGVQQLSELQGQPGITVVCLMPDDVQRITDFVAGVAAQTQDPSAAARLCAHLCNPGRAQLLQQHGLMSPG